MNDPRPGDTSRMVLDKVIDAIAKQKEMPRDSITLDSKFEDLGVDSLDAMEILFELEDDLDIDIPNDEAREMRDVRQVVEGLDKLLAAKGTSDAKPDAAESSQSEKSED